MSTLHWSDAKRRHYLRVQELRHRRGDLERRRDELITAYAKAAAIAGLDERRRVRADIGERLKVVGRELRQTIERYYSANVTLKRMA